MNDRRFFIPQQVTGGWQLYGLSPRQLLRLLPLPLILLLGVLITIFLWGLVPPTGLLRMVLRSTYILLFPIGLSAAWFGLMILPIADAGRTWWDVLRLSQAHRQQQTMFLPRRMHLLPPEGPPGVSTPRGGPEPAGPPTASVRRGTHSRPGPSWASQMGDSFIQALAQAWRSLPTVPRSDLLFWGGAGAVILTLLAALIAMLTGHPFVFRFADKLFRWVTGS